MTMKQEIETWVSALQHYDNNEFEESIGAFQPIADTSKILFNCGVIRATLGEHEAAVQYFQRSTSLDQYLAVAYFQQGVSNFLVGDFEEALANFNDTLLYLRGHKYIDYHQLGLKYKLHACEALFNRGLCYVYLQQVEAGLSDMKYAAKEKATPEHDVIDEAIEQKAEGYTVFSIPVGVVFRPNEAKVRNIRTRDYLGKARLVATRDDYRPHAHRRQMSADFWARDDRPPEKISFAATNLVQKGLSSRRQHSEPPIQRNVFPPTPPPESEKPFTARPPRGQSPDTNGRSSSLTRALKPEKLELGAAAFDRSTTSNETRPRLGTTRSASERPADRHPELRNPEWDGRYVRAREPLFGAVDHDGQQAELVEQLQNMRRPSKSNAAPRQPWQALPDDIKEVDEGEDAIRYSSTTSRSDQTASDRSYRRSVVRSIQKIRIKVHFEDDTRYVIITVRTPFAEFADQIAKKYGADRPLKIKMRDEEGDLITMADQEDLDMAIVMCKEAANKERADVGKMEVWVQVAQPISVS